MDRHGHPKASARFFQKALSLLEEQSKNGLYMNSRAFLFEFAPESLNNYGISYSAYFKAHLLGCTLAQTNVASISLMIYMGIHCGCILTNGLIKTRTLCSPYPTQEMHCSCAGYGGTTSAHYLPFSLCLNFSLSCTQIPLRLEPLFRSQNGKKEGALVYIYS